MMAVLFGFELLSAKVLTYQDSRLRCLRFMCMFQPQYGITRQQRLTVCCRACRLRWKFREIMLHLNRLVFVIIKVYEQHIYSRFVYECLSPDCHRCARYQIGTISVILCLSLSHLPHFQLILRKSGWKTEQTVESPTQRFE